MARLYIEPEIIINKMESIKESTFSYARNATNEEEELRAYRAAATIADLIEIVKREIDEHLQSPKEEQTQ